MKIFPSSSIKKLDAYTIEHEPIASIDLMERAAQALTKAITERWDITTPVTVFAGPGNNGGDALAVARMLAEKEYKVEAYLFNPKGELSADCQTNKELVEMMVIESVSRSHAFAILLIRVATRTRFLRLATKWI